MPQRTITHGLLWLATAALLGLAGLVLSLRDAGGPAANAALALTVLLLPLPGLCAVALRRRDAQIRRAAEARAHELAELGQQLRTPMNTIMGATQLVLETGLDREHHQLMTQADTASRQVIALVDDALDAARIDAGHLSVAALPLRLEDLVSQAVEPLRRAHGNAALTLVCDWADTSLLGARGQLRGDAARLQQVLTRLLSDALQRTASGDILLRLAAGPTDARDCVPLSITLQYGNPSASAGPGAPDLGLAARLVGFMGGSLRLHARPGLGDMAELSLALPLDAAALPPPVSARRVLVAQPHAGSRAATLTLLRQLAPAADCRGCTDVPSLQAALAAAGPATPGADWLLLDWRLPGPGPTGAELLAQLRRNQPALRVALLCPPGGLDLLAHARAFGARAACPEPWLPSDLRHIFSHAPDPGVASALTGLRVLLVEDHPVNQEIALRLLASRGAAVEVALHGQEALDRLAARGAGAFDVVLMDLQMPVLDGLGATRQLRQRPGFETLPVLAMTAHALPEERAACRSAGMQGHITKPLDAARLVRELQPFRRIPPGPPPAQPPLLDTALGLRQFDGQAQLYRRTLQGFANQYADGLAAWQAWLAEGAWVELRRAAHTLQGLAATLGAQPLHLAALALERSALAGDLPVSREQLARVEGLLAALLSELQATLSGAGDEAAAAGTPAGQAPSDLAELRHLLAHSDSRALDWWQDHGSRSGLAAATARRLDGALAVLDFDAASRALEEAR